MRCEKQRNGEGETSMPHFKLSMRLFEPASF
jgi:hypothetical protein